MIALPIFIAAIDQTTVATVQPAIAADLGGEDLVAWIMVSYLFAVIVAVPVLGSAGDLFGRKRVLSISLGISFIGTLLCSLAPSMESLIAARMIQGVGGSGCIALAHAMIGELVPPRERGRFQGYVATIMVTATTAGPLIGGLIAGFLSWRGIFIINLPLAILGLILLGRAKTMPGPGRQHPFDVLGLILFSVAVTLLFGVLHYLQSPYLGLLPAVGVMTAALFLLAIFLRHEARLEAPFIPVRLLAKPAMWRINLVAALHGASLSIIMTVLPIYLHATRSASTAEIGAFMLPLLIAVGLGSMLTGYMISRFERERLYPIVGLAFSALLFGATAVFEPVMGAWAISFALGAAFFFAGTVMVFVQVAVQAHAGIAALGAASASVQFSRSLGAALGAAIAAILIAVAMEAGATSHQPFSDAIRYTLALTACFAAGGCVLTATARP